MCAAYYNFEIEIFYVLIRSGAPLWLSFSVRPTVRTYVCKICSRIQLLSFSDDCCGDVKNTWDQEAKESGSSSQPASQDSRSLQAWDTKFLMKQFIVPEINVIIFENYCKYLKFYLKSYLKLTWNLTWNYLKCRYASFRNKCLYPCKRSWAVEY